MSMKTTAIVFLQRDVEIVRKFVEERNLQYFLRAVEDKWGVLFLPGTFMSPIQEQASAQFSEHIPILYIEDHEDYGWSYTIFMNGLKIAEGSGGDIAAVEDESDIEKIRRAAEAMLAHRNVEAFALFEISDEQKQALEEITSPERFVELVTQGRYLVHGNVFSVLRLNEIYGWEYEVLKTMGVSSNL